MEREDGGKQAAGVVKNTTPQQLSWTTPRRLSDKW
jgi:hypothetical protein